MESTHPPMVSVRLQLTPEVLEILWPNVEERDSNSNCLTRYFLDFSDQRILKRGWQLYASGNHLSLERPFFGRFSTLKDPIKVPNEIGIQTVPRPRSFHADLRHAGLTWSFPIYSQRHVIDTDDRFVLVLDVVTPLSASILEIFTKGSGKHISDQAVEASERQAEGFAKRQGIFTQIVRNSLLARMVQACGRYPTLVETMVGRKLWEPETF
ncbi:MAG: hypothetical protein V1821_00750 [bacterium]